MHDLTDAKVSKTGRGDPLAKVVDAEAARRVAAGLVPVEDFPGLRGGGDNIAVRKMEMYPEVKDGVTKWTIEVKLNTGMTSESRYESQFVAEAVFEKLLKEYPSLEENPPLDAIQEWNEEIDSQRDSGWWVSYQKLTDLFGGSRRE